MIKFFWTFSLPLWSGKLKSQVKFNFLLGHSLLVSLVMVILFKGGVLMCVCLLVGVSYAREMAKVRIICFCIITMLSSCGVDSFRQLKSLGWCQLLVCLCFQSLFMFLGKVKRLECLWKCSDDHFLGDLDWKK